MSAPLPLRAVLFDLDGTLIDSAFDLGAAANRMRQARNLAALPLKHYRRWAGAGARGMLGVAFGIKPQMPGYNGLRDDFLAEYERDLWGHTRAFDGVAELLSAIEQRGLDWGIVTNKAERFALPMAKQLPMLQRASVVIGGDSTPHTKPHPAPVLEACRRLGIAPSQAIYVGDDQRDIQAGKAAGPRTVACTWGYLGANADARSWGADHVIESPEELLRFL